MSPVGRTRTHRFARNWLARFEERASGWRYTKECKRDRRLDLLRGFAVFAMIVDHIAGSSWLYVFSGGDRLFVSAAEGFVFISGVTVGMVYGDRMSAGGIRPTVKALYARAWMLYALAIWLTLASGLMAAAFGPAKFETLTPEVFFEVLTLQSAFPIIDVVFLYAYLMLLAPLAFALMRRWGWKPLALLSWGLWVTFQLSPDKLDAYWGIAQTGIFSLVAWQVLFFSGMILGYEHGPNTRRSVPSSGPPRHYRRYITTLIVLSGVAIWAGMLLYAAFWFDSDAYMLAKSTLPPWRLIGTALIFYLAWEVTTRLWRPLAASVGPLLLPLGQGALYAYAAHVLLIAPAFTVQSLALRILGGSEDKVVELSVNTLVQLITLLLVWQLTRKRWLSSRFAPLGRPPVFLLRWRADRRALCLPTASLVLVIVAAMVARALTS